MKDILETWAWWLGLVCILLLCVHWDELNALITRWLAP